MSFKIGERQIGDGAPCFVIAEVGLAHDGSLGMAHSYVDAVAKAGVDAVKFQCHLGDPVSEWRIEPEHTQDKDRRAYWKRTDFTPEQWFCLASHATAAGLIFLCSPFSVEAVKMLDPLVPAWKVPSGKIADQKLLEAISATGKPAILSSGMSSWGEMSSAGSWFGHQAWLQCTSMYPCPPEKVGLMEMERAWSARAYPVGLSDHSGTIYAGLAAVALGCDILEVHACFSKEQFGFDVEASITMEQLAQLVEGVRFIEKAKAPVNKYEMAKDLEPMRRMFMHA